MHLPARTISCLRVATSAVVCLLAPLTMQGAGRQTLAGHVPAGVATARRLGPMSRDARLNLAIGLPLRNQGALDRLVRDLSDPESPRYRKYLTSEQFAEQFGPTESDYQGLVAFAESNGLTVRAMHPNRMILDVSGDVAAIESAFQIDLVAWRDSVRGSFYAPDREPSLDLDIPILDITGLDNYVTPRPMNVTAHSLDAGFAYALTGSGPSGLFIGSDFRNAYAPGVKLTGTGQTIGLFELDGFYPSDVQANFKAAGLTAVPVQTVLLDGFNGAPGGGNIEVMLDIMMAAYMAPGATKIVVYEGSNWNDVFNRMATDNVAGQLSCSWGFSPINATTEQIFRQMIAQGQSLFQASGDDGAYSGAIMPPSDDPNLTVVGGTHLATSGPGGQWLSETVWPGSGGGVSKTYSIPSYQQHVNLAAVGGSTTMRNIPDVAMVADVEIFLIQNNGQPIEVGGTSAAAPLWAGFLALANQDAAANVGGRVGFVNPAIYALGAGTSYGGGMHDIVTGSNNGFSAAPGFDLTTGWGTPSGQGLINQLAGGQSAPLFSISANQASASVTPGSTASVSVGIVPQSGFSGTVTLSISGLPVGVTGSFSPATAASGATSTLTLAASGSAASGSATATITGASGTTVSTFSIGISVTAASGFTISASPATLGFAQGASGKTTLTLTAVGSFNGSVVLSASGLPAGVTAAFTRGATASTSSLTLTAGSTASIGTTNVTVTGTSGNLIKTTAIALTLTAASTFSLTASPASLTIVQGASASSMISITPQNGFTAAVSLNVSGLPSGLTASFTQNTLNLTASSSVAPGPATIAIAGSSGTLAKTATIAVTIVAAPSFTLAVAPATLNLVRGGTAAATVTVAPKGGFTGKVSLAASGLPAGVTASFGATSTSGAGLTLAATASAAAGTANVKITGTSGSLTNSTTIAVSIVAPQDYSLSVVPGSLTILQGASGTALVGISGLNGFTGSVAFTVSGLPPGVTVGFSPSGTAGINLATLTVAKTAAKASSTVTVTGTSGSIVHSAALSLTVAAAASGTYSGGLLGASQTIGGVTFGIAPLNKPDAVSGAQVPLPAGQFNTLKLLARAVNGDQPSQPFKVTCTDGTNSTFNQSLSAWFTPANYPGESTALTMPWRDNNSVNQTTH